MPFAGLSYSKQAYAATPHVWDQWDERLKQQRAPPKPVAKPSTAVAIPQGRQPHRSYTYLPVNKRPRIY